MDWQLLIVALLIAAAVAVLIRRALRVLRPGARESSACGGCSNCANTAAPPVVTLESFNPPQR